jgi:hypothetical protein
MQYSKTILTSRESKKLSEFLVKIKTGLFQFLLRAKIY